jgi:hypothetical protein
MPAKAKVYKKQLDLLSPIYARLKVSSRIRETRCKTEPMAKLPSVKDPKYADCVSSPSRSLNWLRPPLASLVSPLRHLRHCTSTRGVRRADRGGPVERTKRPPLKPNVNCLTARHLQCIRPGLCVHCAVCTYVRAKWTCEFPLETEFEHGGTTDQLTKRATLKL